MGFDLETNYAILLIFCLLCACGFEFVNGFHDTANAVATVIYTNSLPPMVAVVLSGICNFLGVFLGGITVAMGIVNLLPVESLIDQNLHHSLAMVFSLLITAISWNLGTWYYGLPSSSSHTLIGSILGVGLAFSLLPGDGQAAVNWGKAGEIGLSLLISPIFGFSMTVFLMFALRRFVKEDEIFKEPKGQKSPPWWIQTILIVTCSGVSFSHGANDGQKGVGLIMLILIGIVPAKFAIDSARKPAEMRSSLMTAKQVYSAMDTSGFGLVERDNYRVAKSELADLTKIFTGQGNKTHFPKELNFQIRKDILLINRESEQLLKSESVSLTVKDRDALKSSLSALRKFTDYAPSWVTLMISISLGLGTMVGWRRIVKTIGEKIGKQHLTYAQGMSSEIVAASTIGLSTWAGLPVSTTHVLSSGIAGSMVANRGLKNLQPETVRNILLAWLLTLPVTITMSGGIYLLLRSVS